MNGTDPSGTKSFAEDKANKNAESCDDPNTSCYNSGSNDGGGEDDEKKNPFDFSKFFKTRSAQQLDDFYPDTVATTGNSSFDEELPAGINLLRGVMNEFNRIKDQYANTNVGLIYTDKFSNISKHVLVGSVLRNDGSFGRTSFPSNTQGVIIGISMGMPKDFATQDISAAMQRLTFRYNVPVAVIFRDVSRFPGTVIFRANKPPAILK